MTRRLTAVRASAVLLAGALQLAACAGKQEPPQPSGTDSPPPAAHGSLAECLTSHGVSESGGPAVVLGPPAGVDPGTWDRAMKACSTLAPGPAGP